MAIGTGLPGGGVGGCDTGYTREDEFAMWCSGRVSVTGVAGTTFICGAITAVCCLST